MFEMFFTCFYHRCSFRIKRCALWTNWPIACIYVATGSLRKWASPARSWGSCHWAAAKRRKRESWSKSVARRQPGLFSSTATLCQCYKTFFLHRWWREQKELKCQPCLIFARKARRLLFEGAVFGEAPALLTNIRLAQRSLPRANSLAP